MSWKLPYFGTGFPVVSLKLKCGIKIISSLFLDLFKKDQGNSSLNMTVLTNLAINTNINRKRKVWRQSLSHILRQFNVLTIILFTTS